MLRRDLLNILVKANEFKEGDLLVGGTADEIERREAKESLSALQLGEVAAVPVVEDGVTEALARSVDRKIAAEISRLTFGELRLILLGAGGSNWVRTHGEGLSSEQIASVVKLMTNEELSTVSNSIFNPLPGAGVRIGAPAHFGSRIQPNSPGDDEEEILFSILEGLSYGCGDVILGLNPAGSDLDTIVRLERLLESVKERFALPSRYCVLSDIVKQDSARVRTRVDVGFQSLSGTSKALQGMVGLDVEGLLDLARGFDGLYFETGQGSAITNHAAENVDMVTLEARNYGLARYIRRQTGAWMIVNDVAGFIGPEVFRGPDQLLRACLEDTVMAKLHGLCMGLDICSTFHMGIDPGALRELTLKIAGMAAPSYLMAVAGNADPMLGYLTTSFREHPLLRARTGKGVSTEMHLWFMDLGIMDRTGNLLATRPGAESLYALYRKKGGDKRPAAEIEAEAARKMSALRERGFDLGYGHVTEFGAPPEIDARMNAIYRQARAALYSTLDESVIRDAVPKNLRLRTVALSRDDYISHPEQGEHFHNEDEARISGLHAPGRTPFVQIVISDGLNANAVNENLRKLLPPLRKLLGAQTCNLGDTDILVENGRVRAGYRIGELLGADVIIHLIGERPGAGLDTLSAYITYGRDSFGQYRWKRSMDHSRTTAICGIHRLATLPAEAAMEIAARVAEILRERRSGVELGRQG